MAFEGPKMKLARAARHMDEIDDLLGSYDKTLNIVVEEHPDNADLMVMKFTPEPPSEISVILGDAVHNLRSCLDLLINDVAEERKKPRKWSFPFGENKSAYMERLKNDGVKKLGDDVFEILSDVQAYKGGDDNLRGLHDLDIADKHKLIITVTASSFMRYDMANHVSNLLGLPSGSTMFIGPDGPNMKILDIHGAVLPKDMDYLANVTREAGGIAVLFGDDQPFARQNIRVKLNELQQTVTDIVQRFEMALYS